MVWECGHGLWYNDVVGCKVCSWQSTCKHLLRGISLTVFLMSIFPCLPLSSSDTSSGSYMYHDEVMEEAGTSKPKVPLDEEWTALAKKMLKGGDPEKTLTWRTAEVSHVADGRGGGGGGGGVDTRFLCCGQYPSAFQSIPKEVHYILI